MRLEERQIRLRNLFFLITGGGILFNLILAVVLIYENRKSDLLGERVNQVYQARLERELGDALVADSLQNQKVERLGVFLVFADLLLVLLTGAVFYFNMRVKRGIENNLRNSLSSTRDALVAMEEKLLHGEIKTRTTIHDLKNPLGNIMGFAELLKEEKTPDIESQHLVDRIYQISEKSLALVERLVLPEDSNIQANPLAITSVLNQVCDEFSAQIHAKNQQLFVDFQSSQDLVLGEKARLEETFYNLISNAIKYSPRGAEIKIQSRSFDGWIEISITDSGPGFSAEDMTNAFQYGKKLSAQPTAGESSTGLGLFIVKKIVESHRGTVAIENRSGQSGARVVLRFPNYDKLQSRIESSPTV